MKKIRITEEDLTRIIKRVIEEHEYSWIDTIKSKLKGVSEEQKEYNEKHNLPLDWRGSKEGYHEYITKKEFPSGSN
jgi:hypothetical protein